MMHSESKIDKRSTLEHWALLALMLNVSLLHCQKAFSEQECMIEEVIIKSCVSMKCVWINLDHIPILVMATITLKSTCVIFKSLL